MHGPCKFSLPIDLRTLPALVSEGGVVSLPTIELHKRSGWVGVSGSGIKGNVLASASTARALAPRPLKAASGDRCAGATQQPAAQKRKKCSAPASAPPKRVKPAKDTPTEYKIECILEKQGTVYLVKWEGYGEDESTWEPETELRRTTALAAWNAKEMASA